MLQCHQKGALWAIFVVMDDLWSIIVIANSSSIPEICEEIGSRLKRLRLNKNLTQQQISEACGFSRKLIAQAERGRGDFIVIIAILKVLGQAEQLNLFLPPVLISPIQLWRIRGKVRRRASGTVDHKTKLNNGW